MPKRVKKVKKVKKQKQRQKQRVSVKIGNVGGGFGGGGTTIILQQPPAQPTGFQPIQFVPPPIAGAPGKPGGGGGGGGGDDFGGRGNGLWWDDDETASMRSAASSTLTNLSELSPVSVNMGSKDSIPEAPIIKPLTADVGVGTDAPPPVIRPLTAEAGTGPDVPFARRIPPLKQERPHYTLFTPPSIVPSAPPVPSFLPELSNVGNAAVQPPALPAPEPPSRGSKRKSEAEEIGVTGQIEGGLKTEKPSSVPAIMPPPPLSSGRERGRKVPEPTETAPSLARMAVEPRERVPSLVEQPRGGTASRGGGLLPLPEKLVQVDEIGGRLQRLQSLVESRPPLVRSPYEASEAEKETLRLRAPKRGVEGGAKAEESSRAIVPVSEPKRQSTMIPRALQVPPGIIRKPVRSAVSRRVNLPVDFGASASVADQSFGPQALVVRQPRPMIPRSVQINGRNVGEQARQARRRVITLPVDFGSSASVAERPLGPAPYAGPPIAPD